MLLFEDVRPAAVFEVSRSKMRDSDTDIWAVKPVDQRGKPADVLASGNGLQGESLKV